MYDATTTYPEALDEVVDAIGTSTAGATLEHYAHEIGSEYGQDLLDDLRAAIHRDDEHAAYRFAEVVVPFCTLEPINIRGDWGVDYEIPGVGIQGRATFKRTTVSEAIVATAVKQRDWIKLRPELASSFMPTPLFAA